MEPARGPKREGDNDCRCAVCLAEFRAINYQKTNTCPLCHTIVPPLQMAHDGYVKLNWQDLRVLAIYAQRWSTHFDLNKKGNQDALRALNNIIQSLRHYQPEGAPPIVPSTDVVILEGSIRPKPPKKASPEIGFDEKAEIKPDANGNIPSPFYKKKI